MAFPARLHVLLAAESRMAVVIRRGPSKAACTIGWDRRDDTFRVGQWLKGRIYERRSDLSPDGKHLIYFAMNGKWESQTKGSWTAISRAPYLEAIGLWAKGDCWHGGGLFLDADRYWMFGGGYKELRRPVGLQDVEEQPFSSDLGNNECLGVYYPRLVRDGWRPLTPRAGRSPETVHVFERDAPGKWILRKLAHATTHSPPGHGCYFDRHELHHPNTGQTIACPDWEWAEVDRHRLVWAAGGVLYAGRLGKDGRFDVKPLHDFNGMTFEPLAAPY